MADIIDNVTIASLKGKYKTVLASSTIEGKKLIMVNTISDSGTTYITFEIHIGEIFINDFNSLNESMRQYNQIQKQ